MRIMSMASGWTAVAVDIDLMGVNPVIALDLAMVAKGEAWSINELDRMSRFML